MKNSKKAKKPVFTWSSFGNEPTFFFEKTENLSVIVEALTMFCQRHSGVK